MKRPANGRAVAAVAGRPLMPAIPPLPIGMNFGFGGFGVAPPPNLYMGAAQAYAAMAPLPPAVIRGGGHGGYGVPPPPQRRGNKRQRL